MSASAADVARVRKMTNEPTTATYSDALLTTYIEAWPVADDNGRLPDNAAWVVKYDLHAAAADVWEEKAAAVQNKHDFSADGANYSASQMFTNAMEQVRYHRARQRATSKLTVKYPEERTALSSASLGYFNPVDQPFPDDTLSDFWNEL